MINGELTYMHVYVFKNVGVAIGAGWQAVIAYINITCYYIFGIPLGLILGFVAKWGVKVRTFLFHHI